MHTFENGSKDANPALTSLQTREYLDLGFIWCLILPEWLLSGAVSLLQTSQQSSASEAGRNGKGYIRDREALAPLLQQLQVIQTLDIILGTSR